MSRPRANPWTLSSRPWTLRPTRGNLRPARGENLPEATLGALFHGLSHVLREVPYGSPALDKVPRRATMSGCAGYAQNTMDTLAASNDTNETHSPGHNSPT